MLFTMLGYVLGSQLCGIRIHRGSIKLIEAKLIDKSGISIALSPSKLHQKLHATYMYGYFWHIKFLRRQ